jgi:isoquinoline 1-oxidoreductase
MQTGKNQSLTFGQLTRGQKLMKTISTEVPATPVEQWKIAGQSAPKVEGRAIVTGKHQYTSDLHLPGMLIGKVLRPDALGSTLSSVDIKAAAALPGVIIVHDGDFVGVAAPDTQLAEKALEAIRATWKATPQSSHQKLFDELRADPPAAKDPNTATLKTEGSPAAAEANADKTQESTFTVAYIAHAPLEPRAAVAQWQGDKLTVWTGTQRPFGVRSELAGAFRIGEDRVRVIVPDTGSGYGGKHTGEAAVEAARLAKAAGKPVKLVWTREEEFTWAYFRPAGVIDVKGSANHDGKLTGWEFHNYNSGNSGIETPYQVANKKVQFHRTNSPLRQGSYRGLAAVANNFARECAMDDLAHSLKLDPLEFRRRNLQDARLRAVFEAAAKRFGWGKTKPAPGHGFGMGGGFEKGGYVATCAEVQIEQASGAVKVLRTVTAFECGAIINPRHLHNQVEGAIVQGLGGALFEAIEFEKGQILNSSFAQYRVPRFRDMPLVEIVLLDRKDLPSAGAGECPIIGIAPAIGNAIFNATGQRIRSLPLAPNGVKI